MLSPLQSSYHRAFVSILCTCVITSAAFAETKTATPTNEQIYCQNRAVNEYRDNVKGCDNNLSDIPDQLTLCKAAALDDLRRAKTACLAARTGETMNRNHLAGAAVLSPR